MNVLITSVGNKTNLIKYFRRALFNEGGGVIYGTDVNSHSLGKHFVDMFLASPPAMSDSYAGWIKEKVKAHNIDVIVPSRDGDLMIMSQLKGELWYEYQCRICVADSDTLAICLDKSAFSDWCNNHNFIVPFSLSLDHVSPDDLPVFIKPKKGTGSAGTMAIDCWEHWQTVKSDLDESMLVQPYIEAPEFSVDVFIDQAGNVKTVVPRERIITAHGESIYGRVTLNQTIIDEVTRLSKNLRLMAHNTVQCFFQEGNVIFIEVNARYGGGFTLGVEAGADTPRYILRESQGKNMDVDSDKFIDGLEMVRIQKDIFMGGSVPKKVFCFDLDGTICTESCAYEAAEPVSRVVSQVNQLYNEGHQIVIATARGATSGVSWRDLVERQLAEWGVKYHKLVMDKPFADYYIDNKSVDILEFV